MERHIQTYLREAASRPRDTERVGPFLATFDRTTDHPYLNYAIPDDGAAPTPDEVAALIAVFERRGRVPRLEYLPAIAPAAEPALVGGGFAVEARLPVMTCGPGDAVDLGEPEGIEVRLPRSDDDLAATAAARAEAFGERVAPAAADALRRAIDAGAIVVLARERRTGEGAGGGSCTPPALGATELVGIGVRPAYRRRGVAGAITARLAREAFAVGVTTAFMTPGDEGAGRVYTRAGFTPGPEMLHLRRP